MLPLGVNRAGMDPSCPGNNTVENVPCRKRKPLIHAGELATVQPAVEFAGAR